jgi:hypothetical protein
VIIVDFTKWGLVVDGNVHCFVVCVLYGEELKEKKPKKPLGMMILFWLIHLLLGRSLEAKHQILRFFCAKYKGKQSEASFSVCKGL